MIDGATKWQTDRFIVIPIIKPIIRVSVIFAVTGSLKSYDLVRILTDGGPYQLTEVPSTLLENMMFLRNRYGMGSTISVMLIALCFAFALLISAAFKEKDNFDAVKNNKDVRDVRINAIMNYIQENYLTITLDDLSKQFFLSKPYLSKFIKEKSGMTFGENVKQIRLNKASTLLRNGNMKVEKVAEASGYQNVEHFNRLFKERYGMTPVQYRCSEK